MLLSSCYGVRVASSFLTVARVFWVVAVVLRMVFRALLDLLRCLG